MMQNGLGESFWDVQNVEIEGRSIFEKNQIGKIAPGEKNVIFDALGMYKWVYVLNFFPHLLGGYLQVSSRLKHP